MPIPEFVVELREHVGQAELWLPGVTAVIVRDDSILLVRRSDNGQWTPVTGIVEPGEDPGVAARREALEETGTTISVNRLASISAGEPVTHANGDRAVYLDHTFACTWSAASRTSPTTSPRTSAGSVATSCRRCARCSSTGSKRRARRSGLPVSSTDLRPQQAFGAGNIGRGLFHR